MLRTKSNACRCSVNGGDAPMPAGGAVLPWPPVSARFRGGLFGGSLPANRRGIGVVDDSVVAGEPVNRRLATPATGHRTARRGGDVRLLCPEELQDPRHVSARLRVVRDPPAGQDHIL